MEHLGLNMAPRDAVGRTEVAGPQAEGRKAAAELQEAMERTAVAAETAETEARRGGTGGLLEVKAAGETSLASLRGALRLSKVPSCLCHHHRRCTRRSGGVKGCRHHREFVGVLVHRQGLSCNCVRKGGMLAAQVRNA